MGFAASKIMVETANKCPVCWDTLQNPCVMESCQHQFCQACLDLWLEDHAVCPYCRTRSDSYLTPDSISVPITDPAANILPDLALLNLGEANTICGICYEAQDGDEEMIQCRVCWTMFHTSCLDEEVAIPVEGYLCSDCTDSDYCNFCFLHEDEDGNTEMVECRECRDKFHTSCAEKENPGDGQEDEDGYICNICERLTGH